MSDWLVLAIYFGGFVAWGVYRWFRPPPQARAMMRLYDRVMGEDD